MALLNKPIGNDEMGDVNGIETATNNADTHSARETEEETTT
jgi:hypothetical protein